MNAIIPIQPAHAKLSASGSKKWLTCTPSARLEDQFPDERSSFAEEGTFAHEVFEHIVNAYLGTCELDLDQFEGHEWWSVELRDHCMAAAAVATERIEVARERCADALVLVEQRLDFSKWVPEGFGTGDLVIVGDGFIEVLDLKYGKGIPVDAVDNTQMRLYALGAYNECAHLYDVETVTSTVLQPRLDNYSSEQLTLTELLGWAESYVVPRARMAWDGVGEFVAGEHCTSGFCRARFQCPARAEAALEVARKDFALQPPELLTVDQLLRVLDKADLAMKWLADVQSFALKQAEAGHEIPGWKLVEGRSNRKYSDPDAVAAKLVEAGVPEAVIYERSLLGITALEKTLGKKKFAELLDDLVVKPSGKPTLVRVEDKRQAISSVASAAADFQ